MHDEVNPATLLALAGTNGAGKSSIGGQFLRSRGTEYFNPDEVTRAILRTHPQMALEDANKHAWWINHDALQRAIEQRHSYAFETTLGGRTITRLLLQAAQAGLLVKIWYVGLDSVQRHLARVAARVASGGHAMPEHKIRQRYASSLLNLIRLLDVAAEVSVFDNSQEADPQSGLSPKPQKILHLQHHRLLYPSQATELQQTPAWAKPMLAAAWQNGKGLLLSEALM